jgi:hypothetical protein
MLGQNTLLSNGAILRTWGRSLLRPTEGYRGQTPAVKLRMVVKCRFS